MFSRNEQNETEGAVVAKLLAFKQVLAECRSTNDLCRRFFLDVLDEILDEAINAIPLVFPLDEDEAQRALIARILNIPNVKQSRADDLMIVIWVIKKIEDCIKSNLDSNRYSRKMALKFALELSITGGGGLLLQSGVHQLLLYAAGKAVTIAKIIMLGYIVGGFLAFILAISLGAALYCYINERQYAIQLTQLRGLVNQCKTYDLDDNIVVPESESFNLEAVTLGGDTIKRAFSRDEENPRIGHFKIKYPSVGAWFFHHKPVFQTIALEFQPVLS